MVIRWLLLIILCMLLLIPLTVEPIHEVFVIILAQYGVAIKVKPVPYAKPVSAYVALETVQVVHIVPRAHHHLQRGDDFEAQ